MAPIMNNNEKQPKRRVAIVGSGVSGLGAAWALTADPLSRFHVTLYEKDTRLGGHSNTVDFKSPQSNAVIPVDTGFIVFNRLTYPNLVRFFRALHVPIKQSDMSFAVSKDAGALEWSGTNLRGLFAQPQNILSVSFWRMLVDVFRFNLHAPRLLRLPGDHPDRGMTLGAWLDKNGYSPSFMDDYLVPMTAAIWSTPPDKCLLEFPVLTLIQFMHNHCLLQVLDRPQWLTVDGGSRVYVEKVAEKVDNIRLASPVVDIKRLRDIDGTVTSVEVATADGQLDEFDDVIIAAHGDETLKMLQDATADETEILSSVKYSLNRALLHTDRSLMPVRPATWSSWNVLTQSNQAGSQVCLSYWMNKLQSIDAEKHGQVIVTMNPITEPRPKFVHGSFTYHHPLYTPAAQERLKEHNASGGASSNRTYLIGAWTNYGFHEDGLTSGLKAARHLGVEMFDIRHHVRDAVPSFLRSIVEVVSLWILWILSKSLERLQVLMKQ